MGWTSNHVDTVRETLQAHSTAIAYYPTEPQLNCQQVVQNGSFLDVPSFILVFSIEIFI